MRVVMSTRIGGFRNAEPWPAPGESIDLPDHEAVDLVAAGYAKPVDGELAKAVAAGVMSPADLAQADPGPTVARLSDIEIGKASKAELLTYAAAVGIDVDADAGVRALRRSIRSAHAQEAPADAPDTDGPDATPEDPADPAAGQDGDPAEAGEPIDLDELDKAGLLDLAAEANVIVNPAHSADEIRAVLSAALGIARTAEGDGIARTEVAGDLVGGD